MTLTLLEAYVRWQMLENSDAYGMAEQIAEARKEYLRLWSEGNKE